MQWEYVADNVSHNGNIKHSRIEPHTVFGTKYNEAVENMNGG